MEKYIKIKIEGGNQVSGNHVNPNPKDEMIVKLSVMLTISRTDFEQYNSKNLTVEDLKVMIENRV